MLPVFSTGVGVSKRRKESKVGVERGRGRGMDRTKGRGEKGTLL